MILKYFKICKIKSNTYTHTHTHTHISIKDPEDYKRDEKQWPERRGPI